MSLEIRTLVEICDTDTAIPFIRIEQVETVIPANAKPDNSDVVVLGQKVIERQCVEAKDKASQQLAERGRLTMLQVEAMQS